MVGKASVNSKPRNIGRINVVNSTGISACLKDPVLRKILLPLLTKREQEIYERMSKSYNGIRLRARKVRRV